MQPQQNENVQQTCLPSPSGLVAHQQQMVMSPMAMQPSSSGKLILKFVQHFFFNFKTVPVNSFASSPGFQIVDEYINSRASTPSGLKLFYDFLLFFYF